MKLRCVIEHITYQNPENGYSIMRAAVKDYKDLVTLVGTMLEKIRKSWEKQKDIKSEVYNP